jgi:hypothetical protein
MISPMSDFGGGEMLAKFAPLVAFAVRCSLEGKVISKFSIVDVVVGFGVAQLTR